ncbi:D-Ala-D-Ala carboxypeptidase family metallohydrolase [Streptomyces sp. NBC_01716]|uniref:D-Ala-D-Ala carboxypeptidase family metallohydrolase n=1 Tax=Streptomyces sp. NBC_01716 TaxID=2975917 RepID=UPI002E35F8AE|nr:D-Ala-D-Ala carboxypeptidase family metallohydrolase [Streptomyces sp. NBC_01716]
MLRKAQHALLSLVMISTGAVFGVTVTAGTAHAASNCGQPITGLPLEQGSQGTSVERLQIRVAGFVDSGEVLSTDGIYGGRTKEAVRKFQKQYGLQADGIAGSQTVDKIYSLQDSDCTPIHFSYAEWNKCNSDWSGGAVSATAAKANARKSMWKLEALRAKAGGAIQISSGFRSNSCNAAVGGVNGSRHTYGDAADMPGTQARRCQLHNGAKSSGFREILGQGFPGHNDHTHVGMTGSRQWHGC